MEALLPGYISHHQPLLIEVDSLLGMDPIFAPHVKPPWQSFQGNNIIRCLQSSGCTHIASLRASVDVCVRTHAVVEVQPFFFLRFVNLSWELKT